MKLLILIFTLSLAACAKTVTAPVSNTLPDRQIMCAQDAKQCPDGSWVGRSGPWCEFICPATSAK